MIVLVTFTGSIFEYLIGPVSACEGKFGDGKKGRCERAEHFNEARLQLCVLAGFMSRRHSKIFGPQMQQGSGAGIVKIKEINEENIFSGSVS